jgi:hypothetical protein
MSPGFATGIFGFLFVPVLEPARGDSVENWWFVPPVEFAPAADGEMVFVRRPRQFGREFNRAHGTKLTLPRGTGKRGLLSHDADGRIYSVARLPAFVPCITLSVEL